MVCPTTKRSATTKLSSKAQSTLTHKWLLTAALGKLFEARWVTLLNALLRLYCSTEREKATDDLKRLVHFGVRVYAKAWFDALKHPSIVDGPRIYHRLVVSLSNFDYFKQEEVVRYFLADLGYLQDVPASGDETVASGDSDLASGATDLASGEDKPASVEDHCESLENSLELIPEEGDSEGDDWDDKWSQREVMEFGVHWNAYWAHPENVLVAMFYDEDIEVRQRACEIVLDLQQRQVVKDQQQMEADGQLTVREFVTPFVKWEAESYTDFLDLVGQEEWTCPPVFLGVAEDVLRAGVAGGRSKDVFDLVGFPNNTRCVERAVQATTLASAICQKEETREEILALGDYSREIMKVFRKKAHWVPHNV